MLTRRENTMIPIEKIMDNLNLKLQGWVQYFHYGNNSLSFSKLRSFVENRVRLHIGARKKIRANRQSLYRITRKIVYEHYGLYRIPATAGWKKMNAFR